MTIPYPHISPVIISIGPIAIRWYGVMYLLAFVIGIRITRRRIARGLVAMSEAQLDRFVAYLVFGMLLGARTIYALVYEPGHYRTDPLEFVRIWHGGLSFHGAVIGMTLACAIFALRERLPILAVADTLALAGPPGLGFGRLGNFINAELYGRVTNVPWAMVFPTDPTHQPRHPSQLYEALGEGLFLACLLFWLQRRAVRQNWYRPGLLSGAFLVGYGVIRFLIEFTRQPDPQLGFVLGPFSAGQLLCAAMILIGLTWLAILYTRPPRAERSMPDAAAPLLDGGALPRE
ncbi:MAG: prolipoprotein diacylglyceryl transferase [Gemmatimonadota bacterium]|nr:prolipoprotein diacylglyceryl transferase [Gemmatimonadota bacterium]